MRHDGSHGEDCFGCRIKTVAFSAAAMPTRLSHVSRTQATETAWDRDGEAYKRLRKDGVQPHGIDGAAALETLANDRREIEGWKVNAA